MIRLIFSDVGNMSAETTLNIYKKAPALAGVIPSSVGKGFYESARGYIALIALVSRLYGIKAETGFDEITADECRAGRDGEADLSIKRGKFGKPEFSSMPILFNISHRGETVAIVLSDEREVGVDIEPLIDEKRAAGIESRFLNGFMPEDGGLDNLEVIYALFDHLGQIEELKSIDMSAEPFNTEKAENSKNIVKYDNNNLRIARTSPSYDITTRWTALESVIKMSGGGFADFPRLDALASISCIASFRLEYKNLEYRISLSIPRR